MLQGALAYYSVLDADRIIQFIEHWCVTFDPRNASSDVPSTIPFILFPKQREFIEFLVACLKGEEDGLIEKCRDLGATWLASAFSVWLWLFMPGAAVGWGSRKAELVDKLGDPKCVFIKIRQLIYTLPREFLPEGYKRSTHDGLMKIINPSNDASITGEGGDNIGRGGRTLLYFKDESAHYEHPESIEASLGDNTRVQIDISSVTGPGTVFHRKREAGQLWVSGEPAHKGKTNVFIMEWSDHPDKTPEWHEARRKKAEEQGLLHVFAQEVERDYYSAMTGVIIPSAWVNAAVDAHIKLGFADDGGWMSALDVGDDGEEGDLNALVTRKGVILKTAEEWGLLDTGLTTLRAVNTLKNLGPIECQYDCLSVGAGVKAEANRLVRENLMPTHIRFVPWNAGLPPLHPERRVVPHDKDSPLNKDFYKNIKAQGWWELRMRFERTFRAITDPTFTWSADELISLPSSLPLLPQIKKELCQPVKAESGSLKMIVDKKPEGVRSPNIGDAIMMAYWPATISKPMVIDRGAVRRIGARRPMMAR